MAPDGAGFCPNCGNDLRLFQQSPAQKQQVPVKEQMRKVAVAAAAPAGYYKAPAASVAVPATPRKLKLGWWIAGAAAVLVLLAGFLASGMLGKKGSNPVSAWLNKTGVMGGPMLDKTAKTAPMLQQTAKTPEEMPEDVLRWLQHLEKCEKQRDALTRKFMAKISVMAQSAQFGTDLDSLKQLATGDPDAPDPKAAPDLIGDASKQIKGEYADLKKYFDSYPPPAICQKIADPYDHALDETQAMIDDFNAAMSGWADNSEAAVNRLKAMEKTSGNIDQYGNEADNKVQEVCDRYNKKKWFKVNGDIGNSGMLGSIGIK